MSALRKRFRYELRRRQDAPPVDILIAIGILVALVATVWIFADCIGFQ